MINNTAQTANNILSSFCRKIAGIVFTVLALCTLFLLIFVNGNVKILMLYANTVLIISLIIIYKNTFNKYEVCIFCVLCSMLLAYAPNFGKMDPLVATSYVLSYRYGISSRSLIATFIDIITHGQFISNIFVWHFIFCSTVFISFIISVYLGHIIQSANNKNRLFISCVSLVYLSCFTGPTAYFVPANFGRVEVYVLLFMLILLIVVGKQKLRWIIPVLALFTLATHIILVFFYIPFIGIILLYQIIEMKDTRKSTIGLFIATVCVVMIGFIFYLIFRKSFFIFYSSSEFYLHIIEKTNLDVTENLLQATMYGDLDYHLNGWKSKMSSLEDAGNLLLCVIINIPLLIAFIVFWINCFKKSINKASKFIFALTILVIPFQAIAFFIFFDYGRWMVMVITIQFLLLFFIIYQNNIIVNIVIREAYPFLKKRQYIIMCINGNFWSR